MKIDKITSNHIISTQYEQPSSAKTSVALPKMSQEPQIQVDTKFMAEAQEQLSHMQEVDMVKVQAIKDALSRGEVELDIAALSGAIMQFHTGHK